MEKLLSPAITNTIGGLVAIILIVIFMQVLTKFVRQVKLGNGGAGGGGISMSGFENSRAFLNHCEKQDQALLKTGELLINIQAQNRSLERLISIGEKHTELLSNLVAQRREFLKKGG